MTERLRASRARRVGACASSAPGDVRLRARRCDRQRTASGRAGARARHAREKPRGPIPCFARRGPAPNVRARGGRSGENVSDPEKKTPSEPVWEFSNEKVKIDFRVTVERRKSPSPLLRGITRRGARIGTPRGGDRREGRGVALDARSQETPAIFIEEGERARGSSALVGESRAKLGERKRGTQERVSANGRYAPRRRRRRARAARGPRTGRAPATRADRALTPAPASLSQSAIDERRANGRIVFAVKERTSGA